MMTKSTKCIRNQPERTHLDRLFWENKNLSSHEHSFSWCHSFHSPKSSFALIDSNLVRILYSVRSPPVHLLFKIVFDSETCLNGRGIKIWSLTNCLKRDKVSRSWHLIRWVSGTNVSLLRDIRLASRCRLQKYSSWLHNSHAYMCNYLSRLTIPLLTSLYKTYV